MGLRFTSFNSVGKLNVEKVLLNSSVKVSEQLSLGFSHFQTFFFFLRFHISDKKSSLKEKNAVLTILSYIKRILE